MDELLSFMEADFGSEDPEESSSAPDPSCERLTNSPLKHHNPASGSSSSDSSQQNVTFKDIFGSPDKRDLKELGLSQKSSSQRPEEKTSGRLWAKKLDLSSSLPITSSSSSSSSSQDSGPSRADLQLSKAIGADKNVPYKPESNAVVLDPYSRVRVVKSKIMIYYDESMTAEAALKDRNMGLEYVSLATFPVWYRGKGRDQKNFWISGVIVKKTDARKSAKGNDYSIWELSDLRDLDKKVTVFLFGNATTTLSSIPVGTLVDVTTPGVIQDSDKNIKFSASNTTQVRWIAESKDFGFCQATKKNGTKCTAIVNTWECSFCVYHAGAELKKMNMGSGKGKAKMHKAPFGVTPLGVSSNGGSQESLKQQGVVIADFGGGRGGGYSLNRTFGGTSSQKTIITSRPNLPPSSRMALQGGVNQMNKNQVKHGNPETVKFIAKGSEDNILLKKDGAPPPVVRKPLDLNPTKTRHLTDKDRDLLSMLESKAAAAAASSSEPPEKTEECGKSETKNGKTEKPAPGQPPMIVSDLITSSIVSNPNAASRNFMQYLALQHAPKDQVDVNSSHKSSSIKPMVMSREKVKSMAKALDFVKKNGPLKKADPNATSAAKKRKINEGQGPQAGSSASKRSRSKPEIDVEFDFESDEFKKILNAKSAHDDELEQIQHEEYFGKLEKKEALENKLLNTFSIETNAVMCRQCKYVALSQSDFCKEHGHQVRLVKARKRFFKCKNCGNRTMSLDRLPKRPCNNCNNSNWLVAPVGKERKGPTLPSEMLAVRGHEEKFIGSAGSKMFMHLEV